MSSTDDDICYLGSCCSHLNDNLYIFDETTYLTFSPLIIGRWMLKTLRGALQRWLMTLFGNLAPWLKHELFALASSNPSYSLSFRLWRSKNFRGKKLGLHNLCICKILTCIESCPVSPDLSLLVHPNKQILTSRYVQKYSYMPRMNACYITRLTVILKGVRCLLLGLLV